MAAMRAFREPRYFFLGPLRIFEAATRSSLIALKQRANTDSAIVGAGTPMSRALTEVHLPVPFWPAVSSTMSTKGFFVIGSFCLRMSAVISIRKLPSAPAFHSEKMAPISGAFRPRRPFIRSEGFLRHRVLLLENVGGDFDQKTAERAGIPLGEDGPHLGSLQAEEALHPIGRVSSSSGPSA